MQACLSTGCRKGGRAAEGWGCRRVGWASPSPGEVVVRGWHLFEDPLASARRHSGARPGLSVSAASTTTSHVQPSWVIMLYG